MLVGITPRGDLPAGAATSTRWPGGPSPRSATRVVEPFTPTIRPALIADMRAVEPLIRNFAEHNVMLPKSFDQLARTFREFAVAADPAGQVVGCGALRIYSEDLAEVCSLAVDEAYQGMGIGRQLVDQLAREARGLGLKTVFALTLSPDFFARLGFHTVSKADFPAKVWADCRSCPKLDACDEIAVALDL